MQFATICNFLLFSVTSHTEPNYCQNNANCQPKLINCLIAKLSKISFSKNSIIRFWKSFFILLEILNQVIKLRNKIFSRVTSYDLEWPETLTLRNLYLKDTFNLPFIVISKDSIFWFFIYNGNIIRISIDLNWPHLTLNGRKT